MAFKVNIQERAKYIPMIGLSSFTQNGKSQSRASLKDFYYSKSQTNQRGITFLACSPNPKQHTKQIIKG
jgi:hypothetical protein